MVPTTLATPITAIAVPGSQPGNPALVRKLGKWAMMNMIWKPQTKKPAVSNKNPPWERASRMASPTPLITGSAVPAASSFNSVSALPVRAAAMGTNAAIRMAMTKKPACQP